MMEKVEFNQKMEKMRKRLSEILNQYLVLKDCAETPEDKKYYVDNYYYFHEVAKLKVALQMTQIGTKSEEDKKRVNDLLDILDVTINSIIERTFKREKCKSVIDDISILLNNPSFLDDKEMISDLNHLAYMNKNFTNTVIDLLVYFEDYKGTTRILTGNYSNKVAVNPENGTYSFSVSFFKDEENGYNIYSILKQSEGKGLSEDEIVKQINEKSEVVFEKQNLSFKQFLNLNNFIVLITNVLMIPGYNERNKIDYIVASRKIMEKYIENDCMNY